MDVKASSSGWNGYGVEAYACQLVSAAGGPAWSASRSDGLSVPRASSVHWYQVLMFTKK